MLWRTLHRLLRKALPSPHVRIDDNCSAASAVQNVIVFGRHPNPTTDYYFKGRFDRRPEVAYQLADIRDRDFQHLDPQNATVILCRYASSNVIRWIEKNRCYIAQVILFLDDDIPSVILGGDASLSYRIFLYYRAIYPLRRLNRHLDAIWVSTQRLGETLEGQQYVVVPPAPPNELWRTSEQAFDHNDGVVIAYHATGVHYSEHLFLHPIIAEVLRQSPTARFEVFADRRAARIWVNMPRVTVRKPLSWSDYQADANQRTIDIMLVPLCESDVNSCRAPTKRIDVARFGAAGVFSSSHAYGRHPEGNELLLQNSSDLWIEEILKLINNRAWRKSVSQATRERVEVMANIAAGKR